MPVGANDLVWDGKPGHYEVYYLSLTDPASGQGMWIRYTMLAPLKDGPDPTCALWFMAMTPAGEVVGRKVTHAISELSAASAPFALRIGDALLTDSGMAGAFSDVAWDLCWEPAGRPYEHVHPVLRATGVAKTVLVLPHADLEVSGTVRMGEHTLTIAGARGAQAHLWGSKHAARWAWMHCNDFVGLEDGAPRRGSFVDGVSVIVPRLGREVGPSTPVVGRLLDEDFVSTTPRRVIVNPSLFSLSSWHFEASVSKRRIVGQIDAPRDSLVGVLYTDPDGDRAYCYNSETASMRLWIWDRRPRPAAGWVLRDTLQADGRAHFEYAQREPVPGLELHVR